MANINTIVQNVIADGEQCDEATVERLFDSLDADGQAWLKTAPAEEIEKWATDALINTQPAIE